MSLLDRSKALAQSTWRCEFPVHSGRGNGIQARRADTAEQALVWMRLSVRALISALDPEDQDGAFRWLDHGQWMTIMRLKAGAPYTFTARAGENQVA